MLTEKDPELWEIAKKRASFKYHLAIYIVMNLFFWIVWYFNRGYSGDANMWPIWPTLGWGIGLAFHFMGAYIFRGNNSSIEREYKKLTKQNK